MEEKRLTQSGIPVYSYVNGALHGFCLSVYVRAGSMYESPEENGVTHFVEHVVFRNINRRMNGGLYARLDRCGLTFNAETYKEFVHFYITGAASHFSDAAEIISFLFDPIDLPSSELDPERLRVKSEIRESDERTSLDAFSDGIVWRNTSLSLPITGRAGRLDRMGNRFLRQAAQEIFTRQNVFFYVTGNVSAAALDRLCRTVFSPLEDGVLRENNAPVPSDFCNRPAKIFLKNSSDTVVRLSFDFDSTSYTNAEISMLYDVLFYGECGKVYRELSDRTGLIYSFDPSLERYCNLGVLHLKYEVQPGQLYRSVEILINVLNTLKSNFQDELEYVRPLYLDNGDLIFDNAEECNWLRAYETRILRCPYADFADRRREFDAVTPGRIMQLAQDMFCRKNLTFALKANRRRVDESGLEKILDSLN